MVRRLPVLQQAPTEDRAAEERPGWQWVLIGAGLAITLWFPALMLALPFGAVAALLAFAVACLGAGALVGRFGGASSMRKAALGTTTASSVVWFVALAGGALSPWPIAAFSFGVLVLVGALCGAGGGKFGQMRRPRS